MKNEQGFTLIEMMIAMAVGIIVLGVSIFTYVKQDDVLRKENRSLQTRDIARMTMDRLVDDLLLAGSGFPPGNSTLATPRPAHGITNADVTTITFLANTDNISAYLNADSTPGTNNWLLVADSTGFVAGDNVVFFDVETPTTWNTKTIDSMGPTAFVWITGSPGRNNNFSGPNGGAGDGIFLPLANNVAVPVNKYHTITYTYDAGAKTITVFDDQGTNPTGDDTTVTIASNVSAFTLSYFDEGGVGIGGLPLTANDGDLGVDIRKIQISITIENVNDTDITATLLTDINLRNMGI